MSKRPLVIITISYIIGILMGLYLKINTALLLFAFFIVLCVFFSIFVKIFDSHAKLKNESIYCEKSGMVIVILCIGVILFSLVNTRIRESKFSKIYQLDNKQVTLKGTVVDVKKSSNYYDKYVVKIDTLKSSERYKNINIIVSIKRNKETKKLKEGDIISFTGILEKPDTSRNYKGFNYAQSLKTKSIYMSCKADSNDINVVGKKSSFGYKMWITSLRNTFKTNLTEVLDEDTLGIANALFIGNSDDITVEQRTIFNEANLIHILAISGMHVGYVIVFLSLMLKKFDKRKSKYIFIIVLFLFADLTGNSPSVERAVIMSSLMICSKLFYRKSDTINNIAISGLILLIINPYNILNLGFQLSFLGTLGIVLFYKRIVELMDLFYSNKIRKNLMFKKYDESSEKKAINMLVSKIINTVKSVIIIGISANLMMFPFIVYTSNTLSFVFIISTLLVTPVLGIMIFSGYLTIFISLFSTKLAVVPAFVLKMCINFFTFIANISSNISFLKFTVSTPTVWFLIGYYILIFYVFFYFKKSHRKVLYKLLILLTTVCIIFRIISISNSGLKLCFIDVGQGDSTLIITESNKTILIDGGGSESSDYDVGEKVLVPYLLDRNISKIDYMIFSHFDSDHCKGLFTVIEKLKVKNAVISEQGKVSDNYKHFINLANKKHVNIIKVKARR